MLPGAYGKPRPALIIQSDLFDRLPSVTVLPVTGDLRDGLLFRVRLQPEPGTGLLNPCQVMVDKATSIPREKIGSVIGRIRPTELPAVERALAVFLGFG